jgi:putative salt-induced outer membrane protein
VEEAAIAKEPCPWNGGVSSGYSQSSGNTRKASFLAEAKAHRKTDKDEINLKSTVQYSSSEKRMDTQKWYNLARYGRSLKNRAWYYFTKIEADHDYFANINYRIIPSAGLGYWFSDTDEYKLLAEMGAGYQHTNYRDSAKDDNEPILTPRGYFEKQILGKSRLSQELVLYPSLEDTGEYRLRAETAWITPINDKFSLKLSFIDDYDSDPAAGKKKNDTTLATSLSYAF